MRERDERTPAPNTASEMAGRMACDAGTLFPSSAPEVGVLDAVRASMSPAVCLRLDWNALCVEVGRAPVELLAVSDAGPTVTAGGGVRWGAKWRGEDGAACERVGSPVGSLLVVCGGGAVPVW